MSKVKPSKRIEKIVDGVKKYYRMRRGELVEIPNEWVGQTVTGQSIRKRPSKGLHKHVKLDKHYGESAEMKIEKVEHKEMTVETKVTKNRTLIRFAESNASHVYVTVPGWNSKIQFMLALNSLPDQVRENVKAGYRCHARVNLNALTPDELTISDWEP